MKQCSVLGLIIIGSLVLCATNAMAQNGLQITPSKQTFIVNGAETELDAYNMNNFNYVKVTEIAELLDIYIEYDPSQNAVILDKNMPFSLIPPEDVIDMGENSIAISIESIGRDEVICIGEINLSSNNDLIYDVSAESGNGIFVALRKTNTITSAFQDNMQWYMYSANPKGSLVQNITVVPPDFNGHYYVYVGSTGDALTNVNGFIFQAPKDSYTQFPDPDKQDNSEIQKITDTENKTPINNITTDTDAGLYELFNLQNKAGGAGYLISNSSFTIEDATFIDVSVNIKIHEGIMKFYIKNEKDETIYEITGDDVTQQVSLLLKPGNYQAVIEGRDVWGIEYSIKGTIQK